MAEENFYIHPEIKDYVQSAGEALAGSAGAFLDPDFSHNRSIQGMIETVYVRDGNKLLTKGLEDLEAILDEISGSLDTLSTIQDLHNFAVVEGKGEFDDGDFDFEQGGDAEDYAGDYQDAASEFFGEPVFPSFAFESDGDSSTIGPYDGFNKYQSAISNVRENLINNISALLYANPDLDDDPNSLVSKLKTVLSQLPPTGLEWEDVALWALDAYTIHSGEDTFDVEASTAYAGVFEQDPEDRDDASKAGQIQQNISFAITAAQALNDTQKEEVRRFMFLFEEYYKSASALLTKISQLIEKMAQGVRPG